MEALLNQFYSNISDEERLLYSEIASFAIELGYKPKKAKTKSLNLVFVNSRTKKHILKFSYEKDIPNIKMKFYATKTYSSLFQEAIRTTIEKFDYKYTGCYHCGKCKGTLDGYEYVYPDGRKFYRCGSELISLPHVTHADAPEILFLLKAQHQYYIEKS